MPHGCDPPPRMAGRGMKLDAIAAAFVDGAAVSGGIGKVTGSMPRCVGHGVTDERYEPSGLGHLRPVFG